MAKAVDVKIALEDAVRIKTVLESNPDFKVGKFGLQDLETAYAATKEVFEDYVKKDFELSGVLGKRDQKARELWSLVVRFRRAIQASFGADSPEYGQAGGTRESQHKARSRKPATTSDTPAVQTSVA